MSSLAFLRTKFFLVALILVISVFVVVQNAAAELTIAPLRVEMEDRNRSAEVHLINTSNRTNTYRVEWRYMRMMDDGRYERLEQTWTDFDLPAATRVAPRQITLRPGERQTVRLSIRRPPELKPGDYRAHLLFRSIGSAEERDALISGGSGIQLGARANLGFAVPVLYRVGPIEATATVQSITRGRSKNGDYFDILIKREGTHGVGGDLFLEHVNPPENAGRIRRRTLVHIFPENSSRSFRYMIPEHVRSGDQMILRFVGSKQNEIYFEHRFTAP